MNFIEKQTELHRKAANKLQQISNFLELLKENEKEWWKEHINRKLDKAYLDYESLMKQIFEQVIPESAYMGVIVHREDVVTIAEAFEYYPHDRGN